MYENGYRWFYKDHVIVWDTHVEQRLQTPSSTLPFAAFGVSKPCVEGFASGIGRLINL